MPRYDVTIVETCTRRVTVTARDRRQAARIWRRQVDVNAIDAECSDYVDVDVHDGDGDCDTEYDDHAV